MGCASSSVPAQSTTLLVGALENTTFFAKYQLGVKLGKGGFAQVREAKRTIDDSIWAVKIMDLRVRGHNGTREFSERYKRHALEEASAWKAAGHHPNIVHLNDAYVEQGACFFVTELCDRSLFQFLSSGAGFEELNEGALGSVLRQVVQGCAHLHGLGVVHRDLKPDNLISSKGVVKICDFGLAARLPASGQGLSGIVGTAPYKAPEMLNSERYETSVDVWSVGVIAYVLFYGTFPYYPAVLGRNNSREMQKAIREGPAPAFLPSSKLQDQAPTVSGVAKNFVETMLNRDSKARVTAAALLQDAYLQDTRFTASWPPLGAVLACAAEAGAFEDRCVEAADPALDLLLNELHVEFTGAPLEHVGRVPLKMWESPSAEWTTATKPPDAPHTPEASTSGSSSPEWLTPEEASRELGCPGTAPGAFSAHRTSGDPRELGGLDGVQE